MKLRLAQLAEDVARRDVTIGWITGAGITAIRALTLFAALQAPLPVDWLLLLQVAAQFVLAGVFSYFIYRRHVWASIALSALWALGYFSSWFVSGRIVPPLGLIGLLVWYGLYRAVRGTRALAKQSPI